MLIHFDALRGLSRNRVRIVPVLCMPCLMMSIRLSISLNLVPYV